MSRKISCRCVQSFATSLGWTGTRLARNYREETNVANVAIDGVVQEAQSGELLIDLSIVVACQSPTSATTLNSALFRRAIRAWLK